MMRFVTGRYAHRMVSSAMLGYVYDGQVAKARSGINNYIKKKTDELKITLPKELCPSNVLPGKPIDETNHDLDKRLFTIFHVFLAV